MSVAVSVLIPCYNVEKYLRQCLESVVNQTLRDLEIICINDGSTDSTLEILREYAMQDPRIRIIDKPNTGYGDSMNRALDSATGEYIGIVESDDWAEADMFEQLYAAAKEHGCDMVKSNFYDYRNGTSTINEIIPPDDAEQVIIPRERPGIFTQPSYIWTAIYRRAWLVREQIHFLPTPGASYQDTSFNFKTLATADSAWFMRKPFLHYRRDNENSSVKSSGKIYCVCDEYVEIEKFIQQNENLLFLYPISVKMKYQSYYWNFRRLSMPLDKEFELRSSKEFRRDFENERVQKKLFKAKHYRRLCLWAFHPMLFFWKETLFSSNGRRKILSYLKRRSHV